MSTLKSILGLNVKSASFPMDPAQYRGGMAELFLAGGQGPLHRFSYTDFNSAVMAYQRCAPVNAIINKKAQAYINGRTVINDLEGKVSTSPYAKKLKLLLARPNPLQSWKQFEAQNHIYQQMFGFCVVFPILPAGFHDIIDASSLWNIPGNMISVKETGRIWQQTDLKDIVESIWLEYKGNKTQLPLDQIHIFKDVSPSFDTQVFPESRIRPLQLQINNIMGAYESRNVLINYRGALGILTNDGRDASGVIPIKAPEKEQLQKDFLRYGLKDTQWKFIITNAAYKWQQIGVPTKDLMLFEEIEDDINRCCDGFNYPAYLMAGAQAGTFANVSEAKTALYQDAIIPEADNTYDHWNDFLNCAENGCEMQKDYSHVPALQDDKQKLATARNVLSQSVDREFKNNWIHFNRALEIMGEDTVKGMDKYYNELLAEGYVFGAPMAPRQTTPAELDPPTNNQTA